jgi:hypothetical protein
MREERYPSSHLCTAVTALAIVGAFGATARNATAAPTKSSTPTTTAAQCTAANQDSIKLRTDKKYRQSREQAVVCSAASCSAKVRTACRKRAGDLSVAIPTIIFTAKDSTGQSLTDVKVTMDGDSFADRLDGNTALSADPGQHTFTFEIAGQAPMDQSFLLTDGQKDRRETVTFPAPPPPPAPVAAVGSSGTDSSSGTSNGPLRPIAYTLGGVGAASLIVGGVTGAIAISKKNASESACGSATQCSNHAESVSDHNTASSLATVSTITFIAGGVALAAGVTLFFLAPKKSESGTPQGTSFRVDPVLGPLGGGLKMEGSF